MSKRVVLETASVTLDVDDMELEARFWGSHARGDAWADPGRRVTLD